MKEKKGLSRVPLAYWLLALSVIISLVSGFGIPLDQCIEGEFGYLYIVVVIIAGVIFLRAYEASGALKAVMDRLAIGFSRHPLLLLFIVMFFLYVPGMFTGLGIPAVLIVGAVACPLLKKLGFSEVDAVSFISVGAMLGSVTGPVNIPVMIIACTINMPYEGFTWVMPAMTVPLGILTVLWMGLPALKHSTPEALKQDIAPNPDIGFVRMVIPVLVIMAVVLLPRFFPMSIPDFGTPCAFFAGTVCVLLMNRIKNLWQVLMDAVDSPIFETAALLLSVGVIVQISTLTGLRGWIVTRCMTIPAWGIYVVFLIVLPLLGGAFSMLGAAALLGLPLVLALLGHNVIVVTAGCSLLCALSQLLPPTALVGKVAGEISGLDDYGPLLRRMMPMIAITAVLALVFVIGANPISRVLIR